MWYTIHIAPLLEHALITVLVMGALSCSDEERRAMLCLLGKLLIGLLIAGVVVDALDDEDLDQEYKDLLKEFM